MANSTTSRPARKQQKPAKPHPDFPLFPHATKRWAKKVRGNLHYFGPWDDPQAALELWLDQKDDLLAGRKPRQRAGANSVSVQDACNHYLDSIEEKIELGKRSQHWYDDCRRTFSILKEVVGAKWAIDSLSLDDFKDLADRFAVTSSGEPASPVTTQGHINRVRGLFNWLMESGMIKTVPQYGPNFKAPDQQEIDNHKLEQPTKLLTRRQVRSLLRVTKGDSPQCQRMHAAILLAINTGCQNIDIERLRFKDIDWNRRWYNQPRRKKGKLRRAKLWKRTVKALDAMIGDRQREPDALVFVSDRGGVWHGRNCIAKEFKTFKELAGITTAGVGFQWIRHCFTTIGEQTGNRQAVQISIGHTDRSITANYIHAVYDPPQIALSRYVERWLVGSKKGGN